MSNFRIKVSLFLNYFVFAILLNSVGTVILQVQRNFSVLPKSAALLELFKDGSIAITSLLIASYIVRIGYKKTMLIALGLVTVMCAIIPSVPGFLATKLLFASVGVGFALIKVTVFATISLVTRSKKEHLSLMNFLESFFMVGILSASFLFAAFVDNDNAQSTEWFNVYYILSGLSALAFLLLATSRIDETAVKGVEAHKPFIQTFLEMLRLVIIPLVFVFIASAFFYVLIEQSIMSWLPTFNQDVIHLSPKLAIQMAAILAGSTALGRFLAGLILRKVDWLYVLVACLLFAGGLILLTVPLTHGLGTSPIKNLSDIPLVAYMFPLIGVFLAPIYPAINSVILSNLPPPKHAAMSGLIVVFSALGGSTGSIITGHIFGSYGGQTAFYFALVPIAVLMILLFLFKRIQPKSDTISNNPIVNGERVE